MSMESEKLEKVIIKKPLSEKEIMGFKKFYLKGTLHLDKNYIVEFENTYELISPREDYWSSEGWRKDTIMEDGKVVKVSITEHDAHPLFRGGSNTFSFIIKRDIDALLKEKDGIIIGYKEPEKMKGHSHKAPQKKCKFVNPEAMF